MTMQISAAESAAFLRDVLTRANGAAEKILSGEVNLRETPIPSPSGVLKTGSYRRIPGAEIIHEDDLVSLAEHGFGKAPDYYLAEAAFNPVYREAFNDAPEHVLLRQSLVERLQEVNSLLRDRYGVELAPMDGFRPLAVQGEIVVRFYEDGLRKFAGQPDCEAKAWEHAFTYASKAPEKVTLSDCTTWYAHGTGAALDTLLRRAGTETRLDFGVIFDDPSALTHVTAFETPRLPGAEISEAAYRSSRRMLFWGMAAGQFVNYPEEGFHFDPLQVDGRVSQFAILNAQNWGVSEAACLRATVGPAREALSLD